MLKEKTQKTRLHKFIGRHDFDHEVIRDLCRIRDMICNVNERDDAYDKICKFLSEHAEDEDLEDKIDELCGFDYLSQGLARYADMTLNLIEYTIGLQGSVYE